MSESKHTEQWRVINGYGGMYDVSDRGRVRSWKGGDKRYARILKQARQNQGYCVVHLTNRGRGTVRSVHLLVCEAFIGTRPFIGGRKADINHKNGVKHDNRLENLEYVTRADNCHHALVMRLEKRRKHLCGMDLKKA